MARNLYEADNLLLILTLFTCTYFVFRDFGIRMIYGYLVMAMFVGMNLLRHILTKQPYSVLRMQRMFLILAAVITVFYLRPDSRHDDNTQSYVIAMLICTIFVFFSNPTVREVRTSFQIFLAAALAFAAYVGFFVWKEPLFWKTVYPHLSKTAAEYLDYYVPKGYSVSIGGVTYTNYILLLGIAVAGGLYLVQRGDRKRTRFVLLLLMAVFVVMIMLTGCRGEFVGAVAACAVVWVLSGNRRQTLVRLLGLIVLAAGGLAVLYLALPALKNVDALYRYALTIERALNGADITSGRTELYELAISLFLSSPFVGIGWGKFADHIPAAFREIHGNVDDVHNIYLQFLCETGVIGTILIMIPLIYIYVATFKQFRRLQQRWAPDPDAKLIKAANGVSFVIQNFLLIMGIFDPCFQRLVFWCFYGIAVIYAGAARRLAIHREEQQI